LPLVSHGPAGNSVGVIAAIRRGGRLTVDTCGLGLAICAVAACTSHPDPVSLPPPSVIPDGPCGLPGSVIWETRGPTQVPGGTRDRDISWMKLPVGFCAHVYATVPHARQVKVAPSGELFVASPSQSTAGGGGGGLGAIAVLPDDDKNGSSDGTLRFIDHVAETQGMAFSPEGFLYYQDAAAVMRVPYHAGDRAPSSSAAMMIDVAVVVPQQPTLHWPKAMDVADDGSLYVMNGGEQSDPCESPLPVRGAIVRVTSPGGANPVATVIAHGFRNPIAVRCNPGKGRCFALELAKDGSGDEGGREKLVPVRDGTNDDWGFPCCASKGIPFPDVPGPTPDCSGVTEETDGFIIGNTPFGLDFAPSTWPAPFQSAAIVALHGRVGSYAGARVIGIPTDPVTGEPIKTSNLPGGDGFLELASGWDDGRQDHGRPAAVGFDAAGRLFLADDIAGLIVWIAPTGL
jgi:glucose/arabinose dehydrogenase